MNTENVQDMFGGVCDDVPQWCQWGPVGDCQRNEAGNGKASNQLFSSSPDCYICIALSIDTHMSYSESHITIWLYGHNS